MTISSIPHDFEDLSLAIILETKSGETGQRLNTERARPTLHDPGNFQQGITSYVREILANISNF